MTSLFRYGSRRFTEVGSEIHSYCTTTLSLPCAAVAFSALAPAARRYSPRSAALLI